MDSSSPEGEVKETPLLNEEAKDSALKEKENPEETENRHSEESTFSSISYVVQEENQEIENKDEITEPDRDPSRDNESELDNQVDHLGVGTNHDEPYGATFSTRARALSEGLGEGLSDAYLFTKQKVMERLGKLEKNDPVNTKIQGLEEIKQLYSTFAKLAIRYHDTYTIHLEAQKNMANFMVETGVLEQDHLSPCFTKLGEGMRLVNKNAVVFLENFDKFLQQIVTFKNKIIQDTIDTIKRYEIIRLEYQAAKTHLEEMRGALEKRGNEPKYKEKVEKLEITVVELQERCDAMQSDIDTKMRLLNDKKESDLATQLKGVHDDMGEFYSKNAEGFPRYTLSSGDDF